MFKQALLRVFFNLLYGLAHRSGYHFWDGYHFVLGPVFVASEDGAGTYAVELWVFNWHIITVVYDAWATRDGESPYSLGGTVEAF